MFVHRVRFTLAGGRVMDFAASPKFGSAWLGGRWIWFLAVGLLQRRVMAPSMECAWGGGSTCVISFVCSGVLVAKCRDEFVTVLCHLFNGSPSKKDWRETCRLLCFLPKAGAFPLLLTAVVTHPDVPPSRRLDRSATATTRAQVEDRTGHHPVRSRRHGEHRNVPRLIGSGACT
jgi:hypothetical protein